MEAISCRRADTVPTECHSIGARSWNDSLFLDSSSKTPSRCSGFVSCITSGRSSSIPPVDGVMVAVDGVEVVPSPAPAFNPAPNPAPSPNPCMEEEDGCGMVIPMGCPDDDADPANPDKPDDDPPANPIPDDKSDPGN
eukprot:scaffold11380_cov400-Chaetoceros_neogracile.AAC.1